MSQPIRVLIVDDQSVVRAGLRSLLEHESGIEVVGEAADGEEAIAQASVVTPDVILLDLVMPHKSGVEAIAELRQSLPQLHILVLTGFTDDDLVFEAIKAGATGYLLKTTSIDEVVKAIYAIYRGETPLHPLVANKLIRELTQPEAPPVNSQELTRRELEILYLVARGLTNQGIAETLFISEPTVRTHMNRILKKLNIASRTQAALYALKKGLANLDKDRHT